MANEITTWQRQMYKDGVLLAVQQKSSRLRSAVRADGKLVGKRAFFDLLSATAMKKRTVRAQATVLTDQTHTRRSCAMDFYDIHMVVDPLDVHRIGQDPSSPYQQNGVAACERTIDDVIIAALGGTAYEGETGSTSTAFDTANYLIANGGTGLTKDKIIEARKKFQSADLDPSESLYFAYGAEQLEDLLNINEVVSSDYNTKALVDGKVVYFMGFNWIPTERLGVGAIVGSRRCFAWAQSGMGLMFGQEMQVETGTRGDLSNVKQLSISIDVGAVRVEDKKVLAIDCVE